MKLSSNETVKDFFVIGLALKQIYYFATFKDDVKLQNLTSIEKTVKLRDPTTGQTL